MIIRYAENSYINVDEVSALSADVSDPDETKWVVSFVVNGQGGTIRGKTAKNIMDAYIWMNRDSIYDMRPESPRYKKQGEV